MLAHLAERYSLTRRFTEHLCEPLAVEDFVVQSMPDASPTRWHLAHTTWFFETFVLARWETDYRPANTAFQTLFNSYYNGVGEAFPRARRGLLTRPTVAEVFDYRHAVDRTRGTTAAWFRRQLARNGQHRRTGNQPRTTASRVDAHRHQTCFLVQSSAPAYRPAPACPSTKNPQPGGWTSFDGGVAEIGYAGRLFAFDNERPRHKTFLQPFSIQNRLVTTGEFLEFMNDGGYRRPELWLSLGWSTLREQAMGGAAVLDRAGRQLARVFTRRVAPVEPRRAGVSRQLFRGGCLRAVVGSSAADGSRMGARRLRDST